jgi:hypothetical protein
MITIHCEGCFSFQKVKRGKSRSQKSEARSQKEEMRRKVILSKVIKKKRDKIKKIKKIKDSPIPTWRDPTFFSPLNVRVGVRPLASRSPSEITPPA